MKKYKSKIQYWVFPVLYFFMVWLTMKAPDVGTDYAAQIYRLELTHGQPISYFQDATDPMLFDFTYSVLYSSLGFSPRLFIATLSFLYFAIIIMVCIKEANKTEYHYMNSRNLGNIILYACLCYSPLFICIARFHFSIILVLSGLLLYHYSTKKSYKILSFLLMGLAYTAHEGITIIYGVIILGWFLEKFWLSNLKSIASRNNIVILVSILLLVAGPLIFPFITSLLSGYGFLNEKYAEGYAQQSAGDGAYLLVLVLSLFGSILSLCITSLFDRKNNWINAICISGLFMMCFLFNQKFFYVQRLFMFMPALMGLSCIQVIGTGARIFKKKLYVLFLLSVPIIYLCQLVVQRDLFFGN